MGTRLEPGVKEGFPGEVTLTLKDELELAKWAIQKGWGHPPQAGALAGKRVLGLKRAWHTWETTAKTVRENVEKGDERERQGPNYAEPCGPWRGFWTLSWAHWETIEDLSRKVTIRFKYLKYYYSLKMKVAQSCPTVCDPMDCSSWNSPNKNTGVGSHSLLQRIVVTQGSNPPLPRSNATSSKLWRYVKSSMLVLTEL